MLPFHFLNLLTQEECSETLSALDQLSEQWIARSQGVPFYTLGAPLYMDKAEPEEIYNQRVLEMNELLNHHFKNLLTKTRHCLEEYLQSKVLDLPGVSLPGFHIFGSHVFFTQSVAQIHFDLQYQQVTWPEPPDIDSITSFTLPIILPEHGGGLNWWDIDLNTFKILDKKEQEAAKSSFLRKYLPYEVGKLVVHNGHLLHQIAPTRRMAQSDRRVTLQGHAIRSGKCYYWYW